MIRVPFSKDPVDDHFGDFWSKGGVFICFTGINELFNLPSSITKFDIIASKKPLENGYRVFFYVDTWGDYYLRFIDFDDYVLSIDYGVAELINDKIGSDEFYFALEY